MKISEINRSIQFFPEQKPVDPVRAKEFDDMVMGFIQDVNQKQLDSNKIVNEFVQGGDVELHEVMVAGEKAKTSLELLMQIRNKAVDMYRELSRMQ